MSDSSDCEDTIKLVCKKKIQREVLIKDITSKLFVDLQIERITSKVLQMTETKESLAALGTDQQLLAPDDTRKEVKKLDESLPSLSLHPFESN